MNIRQTAALLGVSERTVGRLIESHSLPCSRIPGVRRTIFNREEVEAWRRAHYEKQGEAGCFQTNRQALARDFPHIFKPERRV